MKPHKKPMDFYTLWVLIALGMVGNAILTSFAVRNNDNPWIWIPCGPAAAVGAILYSRWLAHRATRGRGKR